MLNREDTTGILYHLRVKGDLSPKWADWFEGFTLSPCGDGETLLRGRAADQAELYGMLVKINNLGLPLLLVVRVDDPEVDTCCPFCRRPMDLNGL